MNGSVHVHAPSRLHFGMFGFGQPDRPQFGGVGVMIEPPAVDVTISPAPAFAARGALSERVVKIADTLVELWQLDAVPACEVHVEAPREHTGLGVGTQLALAVAMGLRQFLGRKPIAVPYLAHTLGRGARSAIGTIGFEHGGLIVDGGKDDAEEPLNPFMRQTLPNDWRFVLICRRNEQGLMGQMEADAFARLPPVPETVTTELQQISSELTAAVAWKDCSAFGDAVYRFGRLAGECFAPAQGGPFASAHTAELVEAMRDHGVPGVGQSSWGPTVFAITADDDETRSLVQWFTDRFSAKDYDITIAQPNNTGAQVSTL